MIPAARAAPDFAQLAPRYDELRPADAPWRNACARLLCEASVAGQRVLDVGCGTGKVLQELAATAARAWGVDASEEMLAIARRNLPAGVGLKRAPAEALPFRPGAFDVVTMAFVVHLVDRPRAFAEARRVLVRGGRVAVWTADPARVARTYLARIFPSYVAIERARFPSGDALREELERAGFEDTRATEIAHPVVVAKEVVLERLRGRHISTLQLLEPDEYEAGLACAEHVLADPVRYERHGLIVVAR